MKELSFAIIKLRDKSPLNSNIISRLINKGSGLYGKNIFSENIFFKKVWLNVWNLDAKIIIWRLMNWFLKRIFNKTFNICSFIENNINQDLI